MGENLVCHARSRLNSEITANKGITSAVLLLICDASDFNAGMEGTVKQLYRSLQCLPDLAILPIGVRRETQNRRAEHGIGRCCVGRNAVVW
jgi:hypothetical protein